MARIFELNFDVLSILLAHFSRNSTVHFAHTCHLAHELALPWMLRDVSLNTHKLPSLAMFFFSNRKRSSEYFSFLRRLEVIQDVTGMRGAFFPYERASVSALIYLLRNAQELHSLSIDASEFAIIMDTALTEAIVALPNILELSLGSLGELSLSLLNRMRNRHNITSLSLRNIPSYLQTVQPLVHALQDWSALHSLEISNICFRREDQGNLRQLPSVTKLTLKAGAAAICSLVNALPNLQFLSMHKMCDLGDHTDRWPVLDHVAGSFSDVNLLLGTPTYPIDPEGSFSRNQVQIRRITITGRVTPLAFPYSISSFLELIADAQPVVLSFPVTAALDEQVFQQLANTLPNLKYLELQLHEEGQSKVHADPAWPEKVARSLSNLKLLAIYIRISRSVAKELVNEAPSILKAWPSVLAMHMPHIRKIGIAFDHWNSATDYQWEPSISSHWFTVVPFATSVPDGQEDTTVERVPQGLPYALGNQLRQRLLDIANTSIEYID